MINLLRNKGYSLKNVSAEFSESVSIEQVKVKSERVYDYHNDSLRFNATFPGKPLVTTSNWEESELRLIYRDFGQGNTYVVEVYPRDDDATMEELASIFIASPLNSPIRKVTLDNGGEAFEGISDSYPEGLSWMRLMLGEDSLLVLKAYGGNKFMNSPRAQRFFDRVSFND